MRKFRDIIESPFPVPTNALWLKGSDLKGFINGKWVTIGSNNNITWNDILDKPDFATVATSGSYNDLSDKPDIPSAYTLPTATAGVLGGVKSSTTGTTPDRDYLVEVNSDGTMKVNVPWVDLNTTYAKATDSTLGLVMIGYAENAKNYPVELDENGKMFVNVPWTDTNTTYNVASDSANGLMSSTDKSKLDNIAENANNYTLPNATTSVRGGVLMAAAVADLAGTEDAAAICTKVNALLAALRTAGILTA